MYSLPLSVQLGDKSFKIRNNGDFRMILDCFNALNDSELSEDERIISSFIIFYEDFNCLEDISSIDEDELNTLVQEMYKFMNCGNPESVGATHDKLIDWEADSTIICAAVNNVCGKEIRVMEYLHWWTFMGYYMSVGESTLSSVVSIRNKLVKGKKLEKYEKEFKKNNPEYFTWDKRSVKQKEDDDLIRSLFQ